MKEPVLTTERLILRPLTLDDAEAAFEWASDERVTRYMIYCTHQTVEDTKAWLRTVSPLDTHLDYGFVRRSDNKLIGSGGIYLKPDGFWTFGYNLRYDCWGNGYATEATLAMMDYVRRTFGAKLFRSECAAENIGSARVIEKCGLHYVGDGEYTKTDGTTTFVKRIYELKEGNEA